MADNLESYFKKHLSGDEPGEGNWNTPSDDVWDKVAPQIQKKRGVFIPWRYLYLLGALLLVSAIAIWFFISPDADLKTEQEVAANSDMPSFDTNNSNAPEETNGSAFTTNTDSQDTQSNKTDHEVENTQVSQVQPNNDFNLNEETTSMTLGNDGSESQGENTQVSQAQPVNASDLTKQTTSMTEGIDGSESQGENPQVNQAQPVNGSGLNKETTSLIVINGGPESQSSFTIDEETDSGKERQEAMITMGSRSPVGYSLDAETVSNQVSISEGINAQTIRHNEPLNNKGKFGLGAFLTPTWTSTSIQGDMQSGKIETSDMFLYSTNWGFELKYFISNKFTLVTGIEKSEIRSWSKSVMDFDYDTSTEHEMPTGEKENTSAVPMPTPFGKINTELTYRFPGEEELPDGEPMLTTFETHQDVRYLSIPLGVEYNIIRANRFGWFVEGGLRYNRALRDATDFSSRVLHNGHDMDVVSEEMTSHPTYTQNYLNFYVGTGLSYQFSNKFQVTASGRYFGNITKVNLQDNLSTYVHGFNVKIGVVYIF